MYIRDLCYHRFYLATVIDVVTEEVRKGLFHEILSADNLILMSDSIEGIQRKFANRKDSIESKGLIMNNQKTKLTMSGSKGEPPINKIHACGV